MNDIIEQIARQWFETEPTTQTPRWDAQPESVRDIYRTRAAQFWKCPGRLTRLLDGVAVSTRQLTGEIDRATKVWR